MLHHMHDDSLKKILNSEQTVFYAEKLTQIFVNTHNTFNSKLITLHSKLRLGSIVCYIIKIELYIFYSHLNNILEILFQ